MSRITTERVTPKGCVREAGFHTRLKKFASKARFYVESVLSGALRAHGLMNRDCPIQTETGVTGPRS